MKRVVVDIGRQRYSYAPIVNQERREGHLVLTYPSGRYERVPEGVIRSVESEPMDLDELYPPCDQLDRDAYAALFPGAATGTAYVLDRHQAQLRIAEESEEDNP